MPDIGASPVAPLDTRDPFVQLDELMVVLEALCPVWPERPVFRAEDRFLL